MAENAAIAARKKKALGGFLMTVAVFSFLVTPLLLIWQSYEWLRWGVWPDITLTNVFDGTTPATTWVGIDEIIAWLFHQPLSIILIASAWIFGWIGHRYTEIGNDELSKVDELAKQ